MSTPLEVPGRTVQDRMESARRFLDLGKEEIQGGRAKANLELEREGAEKVFHSLLEACTARVQKYTSYPPQDHDGIRKGLQLARDTTLLKLFDEAYLRLHVATYYRAWVNRKAVDEEVTKIERALSEIERKLRR